MLRHVLSCSFLLTLFPLVGLADDSTEAPVLEELVNASDVIVRVQQVPSTTDGQRHFKLVDKPLKGTLEKDARFDFSNEKSLGLRRKSPVRNNSARRSYLIFLQKSMDDSRQVSLQPTDPWLGAMADRPELVAAVDQILDREKSQDYAEEFNQLDESGFSQLHRAAMSGYAEKTAAMLKQGANPDVRQEKHRGTPLQYAAARGHVEAIERLIEGGATVDAADAFGRTPLMWSAQEGKLEAAKLLLKNGASAEKRTPTGWSAVDYAVDSDHQEIAKLLTESIRSQKNKNAKPPAENDSRRPTVLILPPFWPLF